MKSIDNISFSNKSYVEARLRVQRLAKGLEEEEEEEEEKKIVEKESTIRRKMNVLPKGLTSLDDSIHKGEEELMRMIRTSVLKRGQENALIEIVRKLKDLRNVWRTEMIREHRVAKSDLKEARSRHIMTMNKFEKVRDAEIARLRKANEIETKRKQDARRRKQESVVRESVLRARAEVESEMRLGTEQEIKSLKEDTRKRLEAQRAELVLKYKDKLQHVVSKLTGECREEMKRIDAEMARLVEVGKESRDAFRKESEIASNLQSRLESVEQTCTCETDAKSMIA